MDTLQELLSPDQLAAILGTYDSLASWVDQLTISISELISRIGVDDVII